jgi:hypothetical protein
MVGMKTRQQFCTARRCDTPPSASLSAAADSDVNLQWAITPARAAPSSASSAWVSGIAMQLKIGVSRSV